MTVAAIEAWFRRHRADRGDEVPDIWAEYVADLAALRAASPAPQQENP